MRLLLLPTVSTQLVPGWDILTTEHLLHGYQLHAVEKRIVDKSTIPVLVVFTGDLRHTIVVSILRPSHLLSDKDQASQWDHALEPLRVDGRPKETPDGTIFVTSLAHFRSDYTLVHIPEGSYLAVRDQLHVNINLLRLGARKRTAVTLEEPSDATKDTFTTMFALPSAVKAKDTRLFYLTVLEFIKLVQSALSVFGLYKGEPDGLLCDYTVNGLKKWIVDFGQPTLRDTKLTSRIPDASIVSVLLSQVLSTRNKLVALGYGHVVPKDPFLHPQQFSSALSVYINSHARTQSSTSLSAVPLIATSSTSSATTTSHMSLKGHSPHLSFHAPTFLSHHSFNGNSTPYVASTPPMSVSGPTTPHLEVNVLSPTPTSANAPGLGPSQHYFEAPSTQQQLTPILLSSITSSFSSKAGQRSSYLPSASRAKAKLTGGRRTSRGPAGADGSDGDNNYSPIVDSGGESGSLLPGFGSNLAMGLRGSSIDATSSTIKGGGTDGAATIMEPILDLQEFIRIVVGGTWLAEKDARRKGKNLKRRRESAGASLINVANIGDQDMDLVEEKDHAVDDSRFKDKSKGKGKNVTTTALLSATVAGSIRGLWTGKVSAIVRLREQIAARTHAREQMLDGSPARSRDRIVSLDAGTNGKSPRRQGLGGLWSDGDVTDDITRRDLLQKPAMRKNGNISTEDESDLLSLGAGSIGSANGVGLWGKSGKVRGKLESWAGLTKLDGKRQRTQRSSVDLSPNQSPGSGTGMRSRIHTPRYSLALTAGSGERLNLNLDELVAGAFGGSLRSRPQSPAEESNKRLGVYEDDDLLSSGQASPIEGPGTHTPFGLLPTPPPEDAEHKSSSSSQQKKKSMNLNVGDPSYDEKISALVRKRPWANRPGFNTTRITSWSDPVSARGRLVENNHEAVVDSSNRTDVTGAPRALEEDLSLLRRSLNGGMLKRRRSFHDLASFREVVVLPVERMRIDVELSGQFLIMWRREEHLRNVVATLQILTIRLSSTNAQLRAEYQTRMQDLTTIEARAKVISDIDLELSKAEKISQGKNTIWYESMQFDMEELLHISAQPRTKVLALREKVFGTGNRKLAPGVHGAHGRFNRLQWTLDGRERLVDHLGRTQSEAEDDEEDEQSPPQGSQESQDDDDELVEHPAIKPMWLLRLFTSWVTRWGAWAPDPKQGTEAQTPEAVDDSAISTSRHASPSGHTTRRQSSSRVEEDA